MRRISIALVFLLALGMTTSGCSLFKKLEDAIKEARDAGSRGDLLDGYRKRSPKTVMKKLSNGMNVVVQESFGAPVVAVQVWVGVGSADETDKEAGIAHMIEHMMFKGTTNRVVGETARDVESLGGDLNAFTSYDQTVYHITIASRYFGQALEILSDLVSNPVFDEVEFAREKEVVLEEIRRGKDNPRSRIYKYMFAKAFKKHTYRRPVIGFEETVRALTRDDIVNFHKKWYVPGRMTLVVTGMVNADEVMKSAKTYFGEEPAQTVAADKDSRSVEEPPQKSDRVAVYREDVAEGYMYLGFHVPPYAAEDMAALDVLSAVLSGGESSRLTYRIRTERRLVNGIWAYSYTPRDPGLFLVGANLSEDKLPEALDMILKQLFLIKHEPVLQWEIEKAKLSIQTSEIYSRETVDGRARELGYNVTLTGNPDYEQTYMEQVKAVTAEDLKRVMSKYFVARNLSVVVILPKAAAKGKPVDESKVHWIVQDVEGWDMDYKPGSLSEPAPITAPEIPAADPTPALTGEADNAREPVKYVLENGIRLIVRENHSVPLVALRTAFEAGVRHETVANNGINNFIAETITEGSAHYSSSELHSFVESRGGDISGYSGRGSMGLKLEVPSPYFRSCLPILNDVLRYPEFPEDDVERIRGIILSQIKSQMDQPGFVAFRLFRSELFQSHPNGMDPQGSEQSVMSLGKDDLMDYYQGFALPGNLVIAVVGDVKALEVRDQMEELFKDWVAEQYSPQQVPAEAPPAEIRLATECKNVNQANIVIGFQGTRVTSDDRFPLEVLGSVLSGMSGRLFTNLRGEQSLAYSVYAFSYETMDPDILGVYIGTAPEKEKLSVQEILSELNKVREEPVTQQELERAQQVLIGDFEIQLQRYRNQAANYAMDELFGLGFRSSENYASRIKAVKVEDLMEAARKYIKPEAYVMAVVKPCGDQAASQGSSAEGASGYAK